MNMRVAVLTAMLWGPAAQAADLTGVPRIVDGDTLIVGTTKVRLEGIDSPETDQVCLNASGNHWACGIEARDQLAAHITGREIRCTSSGIDAYRRTLGICNVAGEDLNGWMVREGWALAYVKYSSVYVHAEEDARVHQRGLWSGTFIAPWDWRHRNKKTVILGALSIPINAQEILLSAVSAAEAPSPECVIKGNINRQGQCIYHLPGGHFYGAIKMNRDKRWFCSEAEAETAGCRAAKQ